MKHKKGYKRNIVLSVFSIIAWAIAHLLPIYALFYFAIPAINIKSSEFMICLIISAIWVMMASGIKRGTKNKRNFANALINNAAIVLTVTLVLLFVIFHITSAICFHAKEYASLLQIEDGSIEDLPDIDATDSIALMDTASAKRLGNREIGGLLDVIGQYNVSEQYVQINLHGKPMKVSPLKYANYFKWANDAGYLGGKPLEEQRGVPGYIVADPYAMDADYIGPDEGEKGMIYTPSAYLTNDLRRHIRSQFPFDILGDSHFEVDENGRKWFVTPVLDYTIGIYGGETVIGAIITDPMIDGHSTKYDLDDVPEWVDVVYDGDLILKQYNWHGMLSGGYLNSLPVKGQVGCRKATNDFGYISKGCDIYVYTGVTSLNDDKSNAGFILGNERTGKVLFIALSGADESSAMRAAEGEVSEKAYHASFPSLVRTENVPTYIMVMTDGGGLVKRFACVNVKQYNTVATASTQKECIEKYNLLVTGKISQDEATADAVLDIMSEPEGKWEPREFLITHQAEIVENGNTYLYITNEEGETFKAKASDVIGLILHSGENSTISIEVNENYFRYPDTGNEK